MQPQFSVIYYCLIGLALFGDLQTLICSSSLLAAYKQNETGKLLTFLKFQLYFSNFKGLYSVSEFPVAYSSNE